MDTQVLHGLPTVHHEVEDCIVDSMFSNQYHVSGNFSNLDNTKLQPSVPVFEYQWLAAQSPLQNSILLEREKNFERIQKWLAHQHEYYGYPPPDEEFPSALHATSVVETYLPVSEYTGYLPRYKSEELIQTQHSDQEDLFNFSGLEVRRYYSPNLNRRRRYSQRSDPTLNKTVLYATNNAQKQFSQDNVPQVNLTDFPTPLNYYFYQSGKGNTFPRRSNNATSISNNQARRSRPQMKQQLERCRPLSYDERVMPIPYAVTDEVCTEKNTPKPKQRPTSMLEGRSFVLNGVFPQGKQESVDKDSSMIGNMSLDTQRLLSGNLPDVALTAAKAMHKRELSDSMSIFQLPKEPAHIRVSSAPEPTQNNYYGDGEKVQLRKGRSKRVPRLLRKVKAFSWPKRTILPSFSDTKYSDSEPLTGKSLNKTESGYNTEKSEEKLEQHLLEHDIDIQSEKVESCKESADEPPARPPLPLPQKHFNTNSPRHSCSSSSYENLQCHIEQHCSESTNLKKRYCYQSEQCFHEISPRERFGSNYSNCSCTSQNNNDLSKNVSMSLKDLIKIHEQEIARVSGGISTSMKGIDSVRQDSRKSSLSESRKNSTWKRHTTIGLTNYSLDLYQDTSLKEHDEILKCAIPESSQTTEIPCDERISSPISVSSEHMLTSPTFKSNTGTWPLLSSKTKFKVPITLPKPKKKSTMVIVEPSFININSAREQFANLTSPGVNLERPVDLQDASKSDAMVQTESSISRSDSFKKNEGHIVTLTLEINKMNADFELERQDLHKRLDEQKKVANAYQKLEDRYRRKVCTLKKAMKRCTCSTNKNKEYGSDVDRILARQSLSPSLLLEDRDISVQKVDNILHQLEAWLNQTEPTDTSEISSLIGSTTDEMYPRYKLTSDYFSSPPLEIIDKIDATSV